LFFVVISKPKSANKLGESRTRDKQTAKVIKENNQKNKYINNKMDK
jgi:hypothetical protein